MTDEARPTYRDKTVFLTGATGVVGGWLVRALLEEQAHVVILVRDEPAQAEIYRSGDINRVTRIRGELEDSRLLARVLYDYEVDAVFHLAAQSQVLTAHNDPMTTLEANVRGTYNLLEAVRRCHRPPAVVIASSDKAYGTSDALPYTESQPLAGRGIYDVSKSAADLIATAYALSYDLPLTIARCGNTYGGGDLNWDRIVPGTIRSLIAGERPVVRSNGSPRRDYLFVLDAVSAYLRLGRSALDGEWRGEAFNFGHGAPISVAEIVDELRSIMGRDDLEPVVLDRVHHEIQEQYLDASKARERLGWSPRYGLREGLTETVGWYRGLLSG